ncbi:NnrU family protein [Limnobacter sp.]|uniref:NnrU family protein n=1 Tax=Limnobacter sp. TaxID=2003368 RepID=UPI00351402D5
MGLLMLLLGLVLFLGVHALRVPGDHWREALIQKLGMGRYKGLYTAVSITGFVLLVVGYGQARLDPVFLWSPPTATRHIAALLMLFSMILLAAAFVPANHIKAKLQHPMTLAVKVWALAHLLANGTLADLLLFGSFLVWAVLVFKSARKRSSPIGPTPSKVGTMMTVVVGVLAWLVFAAWLHVALVGISPFAR